MINDKIKALFNFIDFLNSNIENFKQYDEIINEMYLLDIQRNNFRAKSNFTEKLKYDEVQTEIKDKFNIIQKNIIIPIKSKATELNVCNFENELNFYGVKIEIHNLKENFSKDDVTVINNYKNKYIEYRTKTKGEAFFSLGFFFSDLDKILKNFFDFFTESNENEFEALETKIIQVNDISEAINVFYKGHKKNIITTPNTEIKQRIIKSLEQTFFFQIYTKTNNGNEYNNLGIINPENWNNLKDIFFVQRMEMYKESYTQNEKINLELENLENLTVNETDYKILKDRYKEYLIGKQNTHQQPETNKPKKPKKTLFEFIHNIKDKEAFVLELKNTFPTEIGKDIRVIIDTLNEKSILIIGAREFKHFVEVLTLYFDRNIGEYQGIQNKMIITKETSDPINKKLNPLIIKYKTT
jgi:hypothetical protein